MFIKEKICIGPNFILIHVSGTGKDSIHKKASISKISYNLSE